MALSSGSIPSLANGVSQQPPWVRLSSQLEAQENFLSSLVSGLTRRPGTRHLATLGAAPAARPYIHVIDRDETNRFVVLVSNGDLRVFDVNGVERTVSFPNGKAYLNSADPERSFSAVSVVDYTFLVNRNTSVLPTAFGATPTRWGYVFVRQGAYSCNYKVFVDGVQRATYTTSATSAPDIQTENIATQLTTQLTSALGASWVVERFEASIRLRRVDNANFAISARDGGGDTYTRAFRDTVQNFTDLPTRFFDGAWVEVVGTGSNQFDAYYVRFDAAAGAWRETVYPEDDFGPDPATMPHQLVRNANGTFTFQRAAWTKRTSGDVATNPDPSFVFRTISDVFFWKGRLGFLSDDSVCMSGAGDFFRFYSETVTALLDSDPIDVSAGFTRVSPLRFATPYQGGLLLWADNTQFELVAEGGVPTPKSVSIEQPSAFPATTLAKPVEAGKGIFFAFQRGIYAGVREYLTDRATSTKDALDTTIHVPSYITGTATQMAALRNDNLVFVLADGDRSSLFAYKHHWEGEQKLQSSWSRWSFGAGTEVWAVATLGQRVMLVIKRGTNLWLESLEADTEIGDLGLPWSVSLDRKVLLTGVYSAGTDTTTWTLPYASAGCEIVLGGGFGPSSGTAPLVTVAGSTLSAPGNLAGSQVAAGLPFLSSVTLSRITAEDRAAAQGRGRVAITDGRLQLLAVYPIVARTGLLVASVGRKNVGATEYTLGPRFIGTDGSTIGSVVVTDARWRVPVYARNTEATITFKTDSHLPCSILSVDWEAAFTLRSRRI
jgi:hypothetical protein